MGPLRPQVFLLLAHFVLTRWRACASPPSHWNLFCAAPYYLQHIGTASHILAKKHKPMYGATPPIKLLWISIQTLTKPWRYPGYAVKVLQMPSPPPPSLPPSSFSYNYTGRTQPHSCTPTVSAGLLHASSTTLIPLVTRPKGTTGLFLGPSRTMMQNCAAISTLGLARTTWQEGVIRGQAMRGWLGPGDGKRLRDEWLECD